MNKPGVALGPAHSQLDVSGAASIHATFRQAQIESVLSDTGAQEEIPGDQHSDGWPPALDPDGPRRDCGGGVWSGGGHGGGGGRLRKARGSGGSSLGDERSR